ncbi:hypothetical protein PMAYCL1PPCAC_01815, partial [Pristionchus mayeri]
DEENHPSLEDNEKSKGFEESIDNPIDFAHYMQDMPEIFDIPVAEEINESHARSLEDTSVDSITAPLEMEGEKSETMKMQPAEETAGTIEEEAAPSAVLSPASSPSKMDELGRGRGDSESMVMRFAGKSAFEQSIFGISIQSAINDQSIVSSEWSGAMLIDSSSTHSSGEDLEREEEAVESPSPSHASDPLEDLMESIGIPWKKQSEPNKDQKVKSELREEAGEEREGLEVGDQLRGRVKEEGETTAKSRRGYPSKNEEVKEKDQKPIFTSPIGTRTRSNSKMPTPYRPIGREVGGNETKKNSVKSTPAGRATKILVKRTVKNPVKSTSKRIQEIVSCEEEDNSSEDQEQWTDHEDYALGKSSNRSGWRFTAKGRSSTATKEESTRREESGEIGVGAQSTISSRTPARLLLPVTPITRSSRKRVVETFDSGEKIPSKKRSRRGEDHTQVPSTSHGKV